MTDPDCCWRLRIGNFARALEALEQAVELSWQRPLRERDQQGLIQGFEFTHELAWNLLKDDLHDQGIEVVIGSWDAIRLIFQNARVSDGESSMG